MTIIVWRNTFDRLIYNIIMKTTGICWGSIVVILISYCTAVGKGVTVSPRKSSQFSRDDSVPSLLPPSPLAGGGFQIPVQGISGRGYVLQTSTDLIHWTNRAAFIALDEIYYFEDSPNGSSGARFFRVMERTNDIPPPSNDNFGSRTLLSGLGITAFGYNVNASIELGEPGYTSASVWWSWTAPSTGLVVIATVGSTFDPRMNIYTGSSLGALTQVDPYQPSPGQNYNGFALYAAAGTTYQIQLASDYPPEGGIKLEIASPPNLAVTSPVNGTVSLNPTNFVLTASASDPDGSLRELKVAVGGSLLGITTNTSISLIWTNVGVGQHDIIFSATDKLGITTSEVRSAIVRPPNDDFANRILISGDAATINGRSGHDKRNQ